MGKLATRGPSPVLYLRDRECGSEREWWCREGRVPAGASPEKYCARSCEGADGIGSAFG